MFVLTVISKLGKPISGGIVVSRVGRNNSVYLFRFQVGTFWVDDGSLWPNEESGGVVCLQSWVQGGDGSNGSSN